MVTFWYPVTKKNKKGKKKTTREVHGLFTGGAHGLGTSTHWDFEDREYTVDMLANDDCGQWSVTLTPIEQEGSA